MGIDPEFWRKKNSITLNLKAGAPTGAIHGCKCRKKFIFRPPQELLKDAKTIYVVISGSVEFQINLDKSSGIILTLAPSAQLF